MRVLRGGGGSGDGAHPTKADGACDSESVRGVARGPSCQEFEACPDMPAGLLPTVAALPQLRRLVVSDAHLFASTDANTMSRLARLEELRLSGYAALSDSGMAQVRVSGGGRRARTRDRHLTGPRRSAAVCPPGAARSGS